MKDKSLKYKFKRKSFDSMLQIIDNGLANSHEYGYVNNQGNML